MTMMIHLARFCVVFNSKCTAKHSWYRNLKRKLFIISGGGGGSGSGVKLVDGQLYLLTCLRMLTTRSILTRRSDTLILLWTNQQLAETERFLVFL